ncbi:unnamed protein product [Rotaria sordida]|uniref:Acrosin n=1 Tax=Rotaria sordida TaxID=392033 RepID=A0A814US77_9BILA|nr:unnamed protein product [Rotaria sordida]CAF1438134.1 unnamed protein product [Rotaria sordida]
MTICIAVQYKCDSRNTSCGCGRFNVQLNSTNNLNGENAIQHSWPMIVLLDFHWPIQSTPCSGSILSNYFILTSAHCVQKISAFDIIIKAGIHYPQDENVTSHVVRRIYLHPDYTGHSDGYANNIALLELREPLNFNDNPYITPTCLPIKNSSINVSQYPKTGSRLAVIGWQSLRSDKIDIFNALKQGEIFLIGNNYPICRRSFIDPDKQFCAGILKGGIDPCYGDAGGPILQWMGNRWEQVGITSYSRCGIPGYPSIYTRLAFYIDWINSIIKNRNESLYATTTRNPPINYMCDRKKVNCGCGYRDVRLPTSRIIGGEDAIPNSWSMIVSIRGKLFDWDVKTRHICGGTIINEWYVLTAAHCVDNGITSSYSNMSIAFGMHNQLEENQTLREFDRIIIHPLWGEGERFSNDIALLHLSEPLDFEANPFISRTCRPPRMNSTEYIYNYPLNATLLAAVGWGRSSNSESPEILQQVDFYSIHHNDSSCASIFDYETQFCAGVENGRKNVCHGDSGGPILQWLGDRWEQVGIASYTLDGCGRRGYPSFFIRLAAYYDWIEWNINPNNYTTSTSTSTTTTITTQTPSQTSSLVTANSTSELPIIIYECNKTISCGCGRLDVSLTSSGSVGSADAKFWRWTMIVSIRFNDTDQHSCAGTILTDRYILTAAHCVQNQSLWKIKVVPDIYRLSTTISKTYQIDRIHQHPDYNNRGKTFENDIALLHLTESMKSVGSLLRRSTCVPKVQSLMDMSQYPSSKIRLAIIGWRITKQNQSYIANYLQQGQISVIDNKDTICSNSTIGSNKQFCAGFEQDGVDSCPGDPGGPIFQWMNGYWDQVGIISSGKCGIDGQIGIFTRLTYYYDWMMSVLDYDNETLATVTQINATKVSIVYHCNKNNVSCGCGYTDVEITQPRIMNGENAVEGSWSMFVSLRILNSSKHICGGTLLSNLFVLSAAHCVKSFLLADPSDLTIVAGVTKQSDPERHIRKIRRIYIHPNYTDQANGFINDIAILELDYRFLVDLNPVLSKTCVPPINSSILNNQYPSNGTQLVVIGWGTTEHEQPDILQQTEVFTIDKDYPICSNLINDVRKQFCAGIYQERKDSCQGDPGGPIFQWRGEYWEQVGIISYGDGCALNSSLQIYTRLSSYVDWINQVINDHSIATLTTRSSTTLTTRSSTTLTTRSSTTPRRNCALKHQLNSILSKIFIFIIFISLIKS